MRAAVVIAAINSRCVIWRENNVTKWRTFLSPDMNEGSSMKIDQYWKDPIVIYSMNKAEVLANEEI